VTSYFILLFFLSVAFAVFTRGFTKVEQKYLWVAFFAHAIFAIGQVLYTVYIYGFGDMLGYHRTGEYLVQMAKSDPRVISDIIALSMGGRDHALYWITGAGSSTGTMSGLSALAGMVLGNSLVSKCLAFSMLAFIGQIGFYLAFKSHLPDRLHRKAMIASLLVPSVIFWSSGIIKEAITIFGLGICLWGVSAGIKSGFFSAGRLIAILLGAWLVVVTKAYVMFAVVLGIGFWFFAELSVRKFGYVKFKLRSLIPVLLFAIFSIFLLGKLIPRYAVTELANETSQLQHAYTTIDAGSSYQMSVAAPEEGMLGQIKNIPSALTASLFRPFIFESGNLSMLVNSIETTALLFLILYTLRKRGVVNTWKVIRSTPLFVFCFVYVFVFGIAVGLAAPNLGTLSRYRIPMFPAYWMLVLACLPTIKSPLTRRRPLTPRNRAPYGT